ncbi:LOW QUALITY PROTEIN: protein mono-ADP-ribosyltransferase PARP12 [Betta splendens]|uniref:LOW QUALITY PROTEIN: protein mono-ADP-ribosyltransferase PARP12 n=1 Tax=Betta splendens TaxID=158456 RepID=A0A6P7MSD1_BETSP|nr:LOW QUALITY PROTEIN: protein mono-ADP-ribosyltransferase PARP12 [Betta splendens]
MTSVVSKFIIKTLCDNKGCLDFESLEKAIAGTFTVADSVLRSVLFDDGKIAIREGSRKGSAQLISPDSLIVAKTSLRICQKKPDECGLCEDLHLCKYFVCGDCLFKNKCKKSHSLASPHNAELLNKYGLQDLTEKQVFQLLLQNDPYLLPEICPHYNKGTGLNGSCKFTGTCTKLHVCLHYVQNDCKFGPSCKRSHGIDAQGRNLLKGFSEENIRDLYGIYRNRFIIMSQQVTPAAVLPQVRTPIKLPSHVDPGPPTTSSPPPQTISTDADKKEICLYFIRMQCQYKDKCAHVHWLLPYKWEVLDRDGKTWKDLENMEDIEKAYCDPKHDTSCMEELTPPSAILNFFGIQSPASPAVQSVNFLTMTYGGSRVRRLSTASSVSKPPHYILTTQWLWYWRDENGQWKEYGQGDSDTEASVTSQTLENVYLADRTTGVPFSAGKQQYILHFEGEAGSQQMYQQNVKYKTKREVRRRPQFVSALDVKTKLKGGTSSSPSSSSSTAQSVPSHWDLNALPDFGYKLITLSDALKDLTLIRTLFKRTMPQSQINSIQRIQNPSLWKVFQWQKEQMKKRNGGKAVNEQYLFHGTDEGLVEAICEQNFDWRMCGVHGTAYGKGSYFARDASYSDTYSRAKGSQKKVMFVALVLVGEYTRGSSSYVRPPQKARSTILYDSCVDRESDPSIYVIFEKQQIYPEYIINYS